MALSEDQVAKIIRGFITELRKEILIKEIILFGSYAQGNPKEYSDIDLAVITGTLHRSNDALSDEEFEIFHEAQQYDSRLEVVSFTEEDFNRQISTLTKKVKQEGIPAYEF